MDLGIRDEAALVLGSSRGLGYGCAEALVAAGARVVINGLDAERGAAVAKALGGDTRFVAADVAEPAERARLLEAAEAHLGPISILVTNAGSPPFTTLLETTPAAWQEGFQLTMMSAIDLIGRCLPAMTARGFGRIVNIGASSTKQPSPGRTVLVAMKAGLIGALVTAAQEVAASGVTINNLMVGAVDTELLRQMIIELTGTPELDGDEAYARFATARPVGRFGTIQEIGDLCAFLCSRRAGFITGQSIVIDGGEVMALY